MYSKIVIPLASLIVVLFMITCASANVSFSNDLDITDNAIHFVIVETYSGIDSMDFRQTLDIDNSQDVNNSEITRFKEAYINDHSIQFGGYILIDEGDMEIVINSIDVEFEGANGSISEEPLNVTTYIDYDLSTPFAAGDHTIWVLGHPLIRKMSLKLPQDFETVSMSGLDEVDMYVVDERVVVSGRSGIREFVVNDRTKFEYATFVIMHKDRFYEKAFFIPLLIIIELFLVLLIVYRKKKD